MTTNLNRDTCTCGHQFTLGSFRGQPVEFRQVGDFAPQMGCKLVCPSCGKVYFGWIRHGFDFWGSDHLEDFDQEETTVAGRTYPNASRGKFAKRMGNRVVELGFNMIDLSFYESYREEGEGVDDPNPAYLFTADTHPLTDWLHPKRED